MRKIIFKDPDKIRTSKTKRWLGWLTFCMMLLVGQIGFAQVLNESFDSTTIPLGWTQEHVSGTTNWSTVMENGNSTIVPRTGARMAEFRIGDSSSATKLITPSLDLTSLSTPQLTFYYANVNWFGDIDELKVFYKTSASGSWIQIGDDYVDEKTSWEKVEIILPNPSADYYIAFEAKSNWARGLNLDDVTIEEAPTCLPPSALAASNITTNSADLGWTSTGSLFDVEWGAQGFVQGQGVTITGISNPYTLGGLTANTSYSYYVRQDCGTTNGQSVWSGPYSFKTSCVTGTIPFFEGFETGYTHNTVLGNCWSQQDIAGTQNWMVNSTLTDYNRTPKSGSFNTTLRYGNTDWIFYPIDLTGGIAYELKFYARQNAASGASIEAAYGSANTAAAMVNSIIATSAVTNGDYQEFSGFFTPATNGVYYFGIKATLDFSPWHISLDDISVIEAPNCLQPTSLIGSNPTLTSIDLSWDGVGGASGNYEIKWGAVGFDIDAATAILVTGLSHTLNGTGGNYEFVVREICSVNDASAWSSRKAFRIPSVGEDCSAPIVIGALPYTTTDDTANYTDNPNIEGSPGSSGCGTTSYYLNGNDVVYAYTAAFDGVIQVKMTPSGTWTGIFAYADCADIGTACIGGAYNSGSAVNMFELNVANGETYYFVISSNPAPQTVGYTLDISQVLCAKPTGVAHTDVTHNSANLSWDVSGNYEINWGPSSPTFTAGDGVNTNTVNATTEFAFSGLNGNTSYRYFVRQNCGGTSGDSEWSGPYTFTTLVAPASIPWLEPFTGTTFPTGWANTSSWSVSTSTTFVPGAEGSYLYKNIWGTVGTNGAMFSTLRMGLVSAGDILNFNYGLRKAGTTYTASGTISIEVSTDNGVTYSPFQTITHSDDVAWTSSEQFDLSAYAGENIRIRITAKRTGSTDDYYLGFDNFYVGQPITCEAPSALTASNITTNTADLSWTSEGSTFDISWGTGAFDAEDGTIVALANGGTLSGLTAQTTYQYYVRQNCGVGDVSMWVGPFGFTTACEAFDLPYSQDFEGVTAPSLPSCTSIETLNGNPWRTSSSAVTGMTGNKLNYPWHASGTGTADAWFYTPGLNLEAGKNYAISYKYGNNSTFYTESMRVAYGTSAMASVMNEVLADHNAINSTGVSENEVFFTVAEDGVYYFGFQSYSIANQNQLYVDDILIRELGDPCTGTPDAGIATASMSSGESGSAVDFAVTGYENDTEGISYDWEYSVDNGVTWNSTVTSDNEVTFTITGTIGTVFQVRYAATCSFSGLIGYSNIVTFTVTQPLNYCTPTYGTSTSDRLSVVNTTDAISNLNYTSSVGGQHFDETAMVLEATPGMQFTLNTTYVGGGQTVGVWIDWENNNTFDDLGNRIALNYSGSAGQTFTVTIPSDATPGDYRLRVRGVFSNHTVDGDALACNNKSWGSSVDFTIRIAAPCSAEWTGAVSTDWNTAGNWCDNTVPTAGSDVVINVANAAVISTDVSVASITLGAAANVTVNGSLNVGDISVAAGGSLIVANDANLFQSETAVNSGNIIVKRNTVIKHLDYTIWSSPVMGQGLQAFSPNTLASRIYDYNTTTDTWQITTGNFIAGKGVMFRAPNLFDDGYYPNAYTYQGTFTGTPHNGDITMNFAQVGTYQGVGNPYPSNMDIEEFWMTNAGTGTLYFWTNTNAWNAETGDYVANNWATYSDLGGLPAANSTKEPDSSVPVGQGFVVEATGLNSVSFNNDMRTAQSGVFFRTAVQDKHRLWLNLSDTSNELNNLLIGYMDGATQGEDLRIDSKMFNYEGSALYSLIDGSQSAYVIQGRSLPFDDFDVVPLGFRAATSSSFTISLANFDGLFAQGQDIFLKDNLTQTQHNLKDGAYTFVSAQGEFTTRFEVVYRSSMDVNVPELDNAWVVYAKDKTFFIETQGFDMKEVVMYDMLGRVVYQSKAEGNSHTIAQTGANQVLIIKVITADNQVLTKKVNN